MNANSLLPYTIEEEKTITGLTARAGLMPYLDLMYAARLGSSVQRHIHLRENGQGWTPAQLVTTGVLLNLAGGTCVDDVQSLNEDEGLAGILVRFEQSQMPRKQRREQEKRFRKGQQRNVPSASAMRRFLEEFRDDSEEARGQGKAYIPAVNEHLKGLYRTNWDLVAFAQKRRAQKIATLDIDAVVIETDHQEALYSYEGTRAYQPLNVYWAEQHLILHSEFRDGNVPAGHEIGRVLGEALAHLPSGVEEIYVRSDTAAYQIDLLRYLESGANGQVNRIGFAIGADVTSAFRDEVHRSHIEWQPLKRRKNEGEIRATGQEWAEIGFVPNRLAFNKSDPTFRYIAIRERISQPTLPGMETQRQLPFPTIEIGGVLYKMHVIVTNLDWEGGKVIHWYRERCGKSEEAHAIMQHDLAGGQMPSKYFGANAAWWAIMILALNLNEIMKRLVLGGKWAEKRLKAIRYHIINIPGRVLCHARQLFLRISNGCEGEKLIRQMREGIAALAAAPG